MKFCIGDLVKLTNQFVQPRPPIGVVVDYWPVEHSEHGYIYHIVSVRFGSQTLDLSEEDFELVNKIVQKKVDKNTKT